MGVTRRRMVVGASLVGTATLAGCLDDDAAATPGEPDGGDGSDHGEEPNGDDGQADASADDDGTETGDGHEKATDGGDDENGDGGEEDGDGYTLVEYETISYSINVGEPHVEALSSATEAEEAIEDARTNGELEAFVDETDFDRSTLVLVQARGPNLCYDVELETIDVGPAGLVVDARVVDTSAPDELCAQQLHYPTLLVRAVFENEVPTCGSVTVTGADGSSHDFEYGVDGDDGAE
ncbi:hypothetical protein [Natronobeatus ordinarius]|uniref:hypothetical protein n=1 Tax=Natronobeatus ordinarius TaxID=2963433 RepID=UPI0020CB6C83|nr:hypothetical protein [Natronobeatus ordinarius]